MEPTITSRLFMNVLHLPIVPDAANNGPFRRLPRGIKIKTLYIIDYMLSHTPVITSCDR